MGIRNENRIPRQYLQAYTVKVTCPSLTRVVLGWLLETRVFLSLTH
jgi:hypothetical protein